MNTHVQLALLFIDARQPRNAMAHLKLALAETNRTKDYAMRRDILAVMSKLRMVLRHA